MRRVGRALGDALGGGLRGGDHQDLGARQVLAQRQGHVTGARRHVDEQEVGLAPVGVDEELLERLVQHGPAPDDRLVVGDEEPHRQAAHAVDDGRHEQVVDGHGLAGHAEHLRHREAVDVGVEQADVVARGGEGHGQVDRHRRLADTALARGDADHPGARPRRHEPVGPALLVPERRRARRRARRDAWACPWPAPSAAGSPPGRGGQGDVEAARSSSVMTRSSTDTSPTPRARRRRGRTDVDELVGRRPLGRRGGPARPRPAVRRRPRDARGSRARPGRDAAGGRRRPRRRRGPRLRWAATRTFLRWGNGHDQGLSGARPVDYFRGVDLRPRRRPARRPAVLGRGGRGDLGLR